MENKTTQNTNSIDISKIELDEDKCLDKWQSILQKLNNPMLQKSSESFNKKIACYAEAHAILDNMYHTIDGTYTDGAYTNINNYLPISIKILADIHILGYENVLLLYKNELDKKEYNAEYDINTELLSILDDKKIIELLDKNIIKLISKEIGNKISDLEKLRENSYIIFNTNYLVKSYKIITNEQNKPYRIKVVYEYGLKSIKS